MKVSEVLGVLLFLSFCGYGCFKVFYPVAKYVYAGNCDEWEARGWPDYRMKENCIREFPEVARKKGLIK